MYRWSSDARGWIEYSLHISIAVIGGPTSYLMGQELLRLAFDYGLAY